ncbi:MAG: hypothetical protein P8046_07920 [Anaerolineales bacterium]
MRRLALILITLLILSLACSTVQIADPAFGNQAEDTPDALATVLAEVGQATQKVAASATAQPEPTDTPEAGATQEEAEADATQAPTETPGPTPTDSGYPTAIPLPNPSASDFTTCVDECLADGSNDQNTFPEKIELINFRFTFEEFPVKAPYTRTWYNNGKLWVQYNCLWPGPEQGVEEITLTDPLGLPSGTWNMVISVNGEEVLNETLEIEGTWNQWSPPGYFSSCYGKR